MFTGLNSFGFGGANGHILFSSNSKNKNVSKVVSDLPIITCVSSRTEEGLDVLLDKIQENPLDVEFISLFHHIYRYVISKKKKKTCFSNKTFSSTNIERNMIRGYSIICDGKEITRSFKLMDEKKPLCLVFGHPSKYWPKIGSILLKFPIFDDIIQK